MKTTATFVAICLFSAPAVLAIPAALTPDIEARALVKVITKCTVANTAALTFDDGRSSRAELYPRAALTPVQGPYKYEAKVVKTLNDMGAKGTFFVNGNNCWPHLANS